jgi:hypothetical protein
MNKAERSARAYKISRYPASPASNFKFDQDGISHKIYIR